MIIKDTDFEGIKIISPKIIRDNRGYFSEIFKISTFREHGIKSNFVQENYSSSLSAHTIRGLHFQAPPYAQSKLIMVVKGKIFDVAVDIRHGSPTFGKWTSLTIDEQSKIQLFIPEGFAHGFCTLVDNTEVLYKVTREYNKNYDRNLSWNDPDIGIKWPFSKDKVIISKKDSDSSSLRLLPKYFQY